MTTHEHRKPKAPYCWQEKNNTRHIRSLVKAGVIKKSEGRNMLDVFRAITEMLSDNASGSDLTGTNLAKRLGGYALMGTSTVKKTLTLMEENEIISIKQIRDEETGRYGDAHLELRSPPQRGLDLIETAEQNSPGGGDSDGGCSDGGMTRSGKSDPPIEEDFKPVEETDSEEERGNSQPRVLKTRERGSCHPVTRKPKRSPEEFHIAVEEIINHLSELTGRSFDARTGETRDLRARLLEGASVENCILLIEHRVALWLEDLRMTGYLRPETLFAKRHFNNYLQLAREWERAGRPELGKPNLGQPNLGQPKLTKPQTPRPTLHEKGHRDSENVAPTGERRERMLERWKELSQ